VLVIVDVVHRGSGGVSLKDERGGDLFPGGRGSGLLVAGGMWVRAVGEANIVCHKKNFEMNNKIEGEKGPEKGGGRDEYFCELKVRDGKRSAKRRNTHFGHLKGGVS
jgi:hypothetical protein